MAPLPPTSKIKLISCNSPAGLIEFKQGWNDGNCTIMRDREGNYYLGLYMKGDGLTVDLAEKSINGVYINQSETSIGFSVSAWEREEGIIEADITPSQTISGTDSVEFLIDGVRSALMLLREQ